MAYVLGYIAADGAITIGKRGNHYIDINSVDPELPATVKRVLRSNHKIAITPFPKHRSWKTKHRIQIGSKEIVADLKKLGITPKKAYRLPMPNIPIDLLHHFVRGYFDGDGHVSFGIYQRNDRPSPSKILFCGFSSCSQRFLVAMKNLLKKYAGVIGGSLCFSQGAFRLSYSTNDSKRLFHFMYQEGGRLALPRKYKYFKIALAKLRHGPVV